MTVYRNGRVALAARLSVFGEIRTHTNLHTERFTMTQLTGGDNARGTKRDDVFYELLLELAAESDLALTADAIREFRVIIDETVGDFLAGVGEADQSDLWRDPKFKQWAIINTRKIARAAHLRGGPQPTARDVRDAADQVILQAHDAYCASLPTTKTARGPVCSQYVKNLQAQPG
jgi:hypothetical protein